MPVEPDVPVPPYTPAILDSVKNPMIFNALAVILLTVFAGLLLKSDIDHTVRSVLLYACIFGDLAIVGLLNLFAWRNPRFLTYGPKEYIEESRMAHERRLKRIDETST